MALYLITSNHEPEQCLDALDDLLAKGTDTLNKFVFGCKEGEHTGYAIVDAESRCTAVPAARFPAGDRVREQG